MNSLGTAMEFLGNLLKLVPWGALPNLHPYTQGREPRRVAAAFKRFAANDFRLGQQFVPIDRINPFETFLGSGWTIWRGPMDGDGLLGDEEQDKHSLELSRVDLLAVSFESMLEGRQTGIEGLKRLERLKKAGHIRLDAQVLRTLWENKDLIPEYWKQETNGFPTYIVFDGTVFRHPRHGGIPHVLFLYWRRDGWHWGVRSLREGYAANLPSAVLEGESAA